MGAENSVPFCVCRHKSNCFSCISECYLHRNKTACYLKAIHFYMFIMCRHIISSKFLLHGFSAVLLKDRTEL